MTTPSSTAQAHRARFRTGPPARFRTRFRTRFRFGSTILAAGAVLTLGAGLTACEGGVAQCLDGHQCTVGIRTDGADASTTVRVFGGDSPLTMTVGHITDRYAEVTIGDTGKTVDKESETAVGNVKVTVRKADEDEHFAEIHVERG
ncbi:hypothetical protein [Kitasatospora sp. NPDC086791]|uniref:hypothetical protein n=1 Tax=Kitasatospora sp. NPDC086791 TaxID=3155178 RepID=UPI0034459589